MIGVVQELYRTDCLDTAYKKGYYEKDGLVIIPLKPNLLFRVKRMKEVEKLLKEKGYCDAHPYGNHSICFKRWW